MKCIYSLYLCHFEHKYNDGKVKAKHILKGREERENHHRSVVHGPSLENKLFFRINQKKK